MVKTVMVTNNPKCFQAFQKSFETIYMEEGTYWEVLVKARDLIYQKYDLLTHPLAGSVKPNQMPYRTILLADKQDDMDKFYLDCKLIENSMDTYQKFIRDRKLPDWSPKLLQDFQDVDYSLIDGVVQQLKK